MDYYKSVMAEVVVNTASAAETRALAGRIGQRLVGGEVIELSSDIGGGKTEFVRGLAAGADSSEQVGSPTFTISRIYEGERVTLHHFDFYRLSRDPGLLRSELSESVADPTVAVAVEWSHSVEDVLPHQRLRVVLTPTGDMQRRIALRFLPKDSTHSRLLKELL